LEAPYPLPLRQGEDLANLRFGLGVAKRRHLLSLGRERDLRDPRPFRPYRLRVHPRTPGGHQERAFRRVALDDPASALSLQDRVIAENPAFEDSLQPGMRLEVRDLAFGPDHARRIESLSDHLVF